MTTEQKLIELIMLRYGAIAVFSKKIGLPNSTVVSILKRGVLNSSIDNVIKICKELQISVDELAAGNIVMLDNSEYNQKNDITSYINEIKEKLLTNVLALDGVPMTESESMTLLDSFETAIEIVRRRRAREKQP